MSFHVKWLMFDADNTLLDFSKSCKLALKRTFDDRLLTYDHSIQEQYDEINRTVWREFEDGIIDAETLRVQRFARLFNKLNIEGFPPLEFNTDYLQNLVHCSETYEGVVELLSELKQKYRLSLITNGLREVQRNRLTKLSLNHWFDSIVVSDEIGVAKPDPAFFDVVFQSFEHDIDKEEVLVIGDNLKADIGGARDFGFKTCWISHNRQADNGIIPDMTIQHISEFRDALAQLV